MRSSKVLTCSVVGTKHTGSRWSSEVDKTAEAVGALVASLGLTVVTGGLGGVMESAARGARLCGSHVIGILPTGNPADANPYITHVVPTAIGYARNAIVAMTGDMMIALPGGYGTLQEITFAVDFGRPVIILDEGFSHDVPEAARAANLNDVREWLHRQIEAKRVPHG